MSPVLLFASLDTADGAQPQVDFVYARCAVGASSTCSLAGLDRQPLVASSRASGLCLGKLAGTTDTTHGYVAINTPTNQCFATAALTMTISLEGAAITLRDARIGAQYGTTGLGTGLIRGFVTEADAANTFLPLPGFGDIPLASLLPGGRDSCASYSDKDTNGQGEPGWWFYLNFSATKTSYTN